MKSHLNVVDGSKIRAGHHDKPSIYLPILIKSRKLIKPETKDSHKEIAVKLFSFCSKRIEFTIFHISITPLLDQSTYKPGPREAQDNYSKILTLNTIMRHMCVNDRSSAMIGKIGQNDFSRVFNTSPNKLLLRPQSLGSQQCGPQCD